MALKTKGTAKKTFISDNDALEWAERQFKGSTNSKDHEEWARFRLMTGNVPRDFWGYPKVVAYFDPDGAVSHFVALDKDGDEVRRY